MNTTFFVPGIPMAKQSFVVTGRGRGMTPQRTSAWVDTVNLHARACRASKFMDWDTTANYSVGLIFVLPKGKNPDIDNLCKAVLDGMNGVLWDDDRQVMSLYAIKLKTIANGNLDPGVHVMVNSIE